MIPAVQKKSCMALAKWAQLAANELSNCDTKKLSSLLTRRMPSSVLHSGELWRSQ
jgi:hypothetical protein